MAKLGKSEYPSGHGPGDFQCFGPVAEKDGQFDGVYMADMGCFKQDEVDSNKYYHAAVVQSRKTGEWFMYVEFGRVGAKNPQFQFEQHGSKEAAQKAFASQVHSKNDRRGEWKTIAGLQTLVAKPGKDVYKVQRLASRSTGLPDAKNVVNSNTVAPAKVSASSPTPVAGKPKIKVDVQPEVLSLLRDLNVGTVTYTRSSLEGGNIPAQAAIDEARTVLDAALQRISVVGDNTDAQVNDHDLKQLTYELYSRIPKKKDQRVAAQDWILNHNNYLRWKDDLDAFESAGHSAATEAEQEFNPYGDLPVLLEYLPPGSELGKFIHSWMPGATANRHGHIGSLRVKNLWKVTRQGDDKIFATGLERCRVVGSIDHRPLFQPSSRPDISRDELKRYVSTNTTLLFHGTRSVNVSGIMRTMLRKPNLLKGVAISGALLGVGVGYFADDWKKSAGYTSLSGSVWSSGGGAIRGRSAFMFLMDCSLGKPHLAPRTHGYTAAPSGFHSVFGKAGHTDCGSWGSLKNNEWVIYEREQIQIRYLVEFEA